MNKVCGCCGSDKRVCEGFGNLPSKSVCITCFNALTIGRIVKNDPALDVKEFLYELGSNDGMDSMLMW